MSEQGTPKHLETANEGRGTLRRAIVRAVRLHRAVGPPDVNLVICETDDARHLTSAVEAINTVLAWSRRFAALERLELLIARRSDCLVIDVVCDGAAIPPVGDVGQHDAHLELLHLRLAKVRGELSITQAPSHFGLHIELID